MRHVLHLLLVLIASSLMVTATVHARELPGTVTIECSGALHQDGDADQSQGDADKATPHHHGTCHGQSMQVPTSGSLPLAQLSMALRGRAADAQAMVSSAISPALRPPTA